MDSDLDFSSAEIELTGTLNTFTNIAEGEFEIKKWFSYGSVPREKADWSATKVY